MSPKDQAEGYFKPKPAPEKPLDEEARRAANMARQRAERLAREAAEKGS